MEVWTWVVAYIVGFSLLQLLVYRYFRNRGSVEQPSSAKATDGYSVAVEQVEPGGREAETGDGIRCQQCGAHNESESAIRYCRRCTSPLR